MDPLGYIGIARIIARALGAVRKSEESALDANTEVL